MFDSAILLVVGLLLLTTTLLAFSVLEEIGRSYSGSVKVEQFGVAVISGVLLLVIVGVLIERHIRIV